MAKSVKGGSNPSKLVDILKEALVGKFIEHTNQYGRTVTLQVEDVKMEKHTQEYEVEPANSGNDWWPRTAERVWYDIEIVFVDGSSITHDWEGDFKFVHRGGGIHLA